MKLKPVTMPRDVIQIIRGLTITELRQAIASYLEEFDQAATQDAQDPRASSRPGCAALLAYTARVLSERCQEERQRRHDAEYAEAESRG